MELRPLYAPTVPISRAEPFNTVMAPTAEPDAIVVSALLVLLSVIALLPTKIKPLPPESEMAPEIVIAPAVLPIRVMPAKVTAPI